MSKKLASLTAIIFMFVCLFIYLLFYTYQLNNNMDICMSHYKDYDYCNSKVNE